MSSTSGLPDTIRFINPRTCSTNVSTSPSHDCDSPQLWTERAATEFLSAIDSEDPESKLNSWTVLAVADRLIPAQIEAFSVDGAIRTHVKVARNVQYKLEEDGKSKQAREFRTRIQANAKVAFRTSWSEASSLLADGKAANTFKLRRSCVLLSDMLSYGLFPERFYMLLVGETLNLAHSQSTLHTAVRQLMFTASTSGVLKLTEAIREPVQFSRELLLIAFARLEETGVKATDPLCRELNKMSWVVPDAREVKVEYERLNDTHEVCEELRSQASLWKLQFNDVKQLNGEH